MNKETAQKDQAEMIAAANDIIREATIRLNLARAEQDLSAASSAADDLRYAKMALRNIRFMGPGADWD